MPLPADAFYLESLPTTLQQGDIIDGVPLTLLPPRDHLVLIRSARQQFSFENLELGEATLVDERVLRDAFDREFEYAAVAVQRAKAMIITPTCDLKKIEETGGLWLAWPLKPIDGSGLDEGNLKAGKFNNLYGLPNHKYFDRLFVELTDVRSVRPEQCSLSKRIASTTRLAQDDMLQKFHRSMGRVWGYAEGEIIEAFSKYETGKFRCAGCNLYDIDLPTPITLKPGDHAPACENCKKIGRHAQWYPLSRHKRN